MNTGIGLTFAAIMILAIVGWVKNIVAFSECDFEAPYECEVMHGIGIPVAPVGAVMGWIDVGK